MTASLPSDYASTRASIHRVATHVIARARSQRTTRFGLRVTPGGFGTPAMSADDEVIRVAAGALVRERRTDDGYRTNTISLNGSTLRELAAFVEIDLETSLDVGTDTVRLGDLDEEIVVDHSALELVTTWFGLGATALDAVLANLDPGSSPSVVQLWPEHFDVAFDAAVGDARVTLGASPGDRFSDEPYLYVGVAPDARTRMPDFWNAPFGAMLARSDVVETPDAWFTAVTFFRRGIALVQPD